jgi:hypothetical protein
MWEKYLNLEKRSLPESPFIKMTYDVRGCMTFSSNELGSALIMEYFVGTRPYRLHAWPLGWRGTPWRPIFVLSHEKYFFHFQSTEIGFLCEAATKTRNRKLGTAPHTNIRPPEIHISALVSLRHHPEVYFGFCESSYRFYWNRGEFAL